MKWCNDECITRLIVSNCSNAEGSHTLKMFYSGISACIIAHDTVGFLIVQPTYIKVDGPKFIRSMSCRVAFQVTIVEISQFVGALTVIPSCSYGSFLTAAGPSMCFLLSTEACIKHYSYNGSFDMSALHGHHCPRLNRYKKSLLTKQN